MKKTFGFVVACVFSMSANAELMTLDFNSLSGGYPSYSAGGATLSPVGGGSMVASSSPNGTTALLSSSSSPYPYIQASFDVATDFVSIDLGDYNADSDDIFLRAYDQFSNLIGTATYALPTSFVGMHTLSLSVAGIDHVIFGGDGGSGSSVYADNLTFQAVPVPAAVWLFGSALMGLGWLRRKSVS